MYIYIYIQYESYKSYESYCNISLLLHISWFGSDPAWLAAAGPARDFLFNSTKTSRYSTKPILNAWVLFEPSGKSGVSLVDTQDSANWKTGQKSRFPCSWAMSALWCGNFTGAFWFQFDANICKTNDALRVATLRSQHLPGCSSRCPKKTGRIRKGENVKKKRWRLCNIQSNVNLHGIWNFLLLLSTVKHY